MSDKKSYPHLGQAVVLALMLLGAIILSNVVLRVIVEITGIEFDAISNAASWAIKLVSYVLVLLWALRKIEQPLWEIFAFRLFSPIFLLPFAALLFGFGIIASDVDNAFRYFRLVPERAPVIFEPQAISGAVSLLVLAVVFPICKELFFRGIVLRGLLSNYSSRKAILVSAFLFCVCQLNPYQAISSFAFGIVLAWVFVETGSLWPCILGHAFYNLRWTLGALLPITITGYTPIIQDSGIVEFQPIWFNMLGLACILAGLVGMAKIFVNGRGPKFERRVQPLSNAGRKASRFYLIKGVGKFH
jgi:membrane protease YdiL (CAAX protease family)